MRLLVCNSCKTIEPLPDYDGNPDDDTVLNAALIPHKPILGPEHRGQLATIEDKHWNNPRIRHDVLSRLNSAQSTGLENGFYVTKATAMEDAMACWKKHLRPADSCPDYMTESKRMAPDTAELRKEAGLEKRRVDPKSDVHLCHYCPIHVKVLEKRKAAAGLYLP